MGTKVKLLAALTVAGVLGVVSVPSAKEARQSGHTTTLNFTTKAVQEAELDLGKKGFGVGDRFVFSENAFRNGRRVGELGGECTIVRIQPRVVQEGEEPRSVLINCAATLRLSDGQITLQGLVSFTERGGPPRVAVTGGSGAYRGAAGEAVVGENSLRLQLVRHGSPSFAG